MNMPIMNGLDTISAIRANPAFKKIDVVMLSTSSNPDLIKKARQAGVTEFVIKPYRFEDYTKISGRLIQKYF